MESEFILFNKKYLHVLQESRKCKNKTDFECLQGKCILEKTIKILYRQLTKEIMLIFRGNCLMSKLFTSVLLKIFLALKGRK